MYKSILHVCGISFGLLAKHDEGTVEIEDNLQEDKAHPFMSCGADTSAAKNSQ